MKKLKTISFIAGLVLLSTLMACGGAIVGVKKQRQAELNMNFYQRWVNAYEEQGGNSTLNIFRPGDSQAYSQGGFRMEYEFNPNGECAYKDKNSGNMWQCVYTKIGKKVYLYNQQGQLLRHLIFTLVEEPSQDKMRLTYGIKGPAKKEEKAKK